jgi:transcriptional regulator with XRE-family HTH domain
MWFGCSASKIQRHPGSASYKFTKAQLAEALGRAHSFVAKYEGRERRLEVAECLEIARELGADPYKLLRAADKQSGAR